MISSAFAKVELSEKAERERTADFFVYALYRPLSLALTPLFLRLGATATAVTLLNLLLACALPLIALGALERAYLWVALITFWCIVLDCVDGNIARATGSSSPFGQYLDSFGGKVYFVSLMATLALLAAHESPDIGLGFWLALGLSGALLKIWSRETRAYFRLTFSEHAVAFAPGAVGWKSLLFSAAKLLPFGLLVLGPFGLTYLLLYALLLLNAAAFLHTQARIIKKLAG